MLIKKADLYFLGLGVMAIGLPVSEFLMSLSYMIIALAWLIDGTKKRQWNDFKNNKLAWSGVLLFLIPLIAFFWSSNLDYALSDLRIKLPLLLIPFLISSYTLSTKKFHILLGLLIGSTFVGSVILFINYHLKLEGNLVNLRDVSIFISHIRFSLIIDICIFILFYAAIKWKNIYSLVAIGMSIWFIYFLFFLGSGNGFIGLLTVLLFSIVLLLVRSPYRKLSYVVLALFIVFSSYILFLGKASYQSHFVVKNEVYNTDSAIVLGATRFSLLEDKQLENGYYIWRNVSNKELIREWGKLSEPAYYEYDTKGQPILGTLVRYLTSKALTKDSLGIHQLNAKDIENIQQGNYHFEQYRWNNLQFRIDQLFYQLMAYYYQDDPGNKPFLQRYYYWKGGVSIIKEHPFFGVGTGDIQDSLNDYFKNEVSEMGSEFRHHTHNQYLSYFITSGVFGFLLFLWAVFYPLKLNRKHSKILLLAHIVLLISFITEDTLETQPGVTLYVLFIALAIALYNGNKEVSEAEYP